jgi:hypothetical protein
MQLEYRRRMLQAIPGQMSGSGLYRTEALRNSAAYTKNKWTLTAPGTVDNSATYTISVEYKEWDAIESVSVLTDSDATQAELVAALQLALRGNHKINGLLKITTTSTTVVLTARKDGISVTVTCPTNGTTTNDITVAETDAVASPATIGFGLAIVRTAISTQTGGGGIGRLPNTSEVIHGFTRTTDFLQKEGVGEAATSGYIPNDTMNVVTDTGTYDGMWVQTPESTIALTDTVWVSVDSATKGQVVKADGGSDISLSGKASFQSPVIQSVNRKNLVLVKFAL